MFDAMEIENVSAVDLLIDGPPQVIESVIELSSRRGHVTDIIRELSLRYDVATPARSAC